MFPLRLRASLLICCSVLVYPSPCAFAQTVSLYPAMAAADNLPPPKCDSYSMQTLPSLDLHQRACFWRMQLLTGNALAGAAFWGAIGEWRHKPPEWPQGLDGFGRQMSTRYAQGAVKSTGTFVASLISREDPRPKPPPILACSHPSSWNGRLGHSLLRVVWNERLDTDGKCGGRVAPGRLAGSFASGFVGMAWRPDSQNKLSTSLVASGTAFGGYLGNSVLEEFKGDLFRLLGGVVKGSRKK